MPDVDDEMCFACGEKNPISLNLDFKQIDDNKVKALFVPGEYHQGYNGIIHGGLTSTLLDEAMAYVIGFKGIKAFTAELNIRFKSSIKVGEEIEIYGYYIKKKESSIAVVHYASAEIYDKNGKLKAKAKSKFVEE